MKMKERKWTLIIFVIILIAYILPYTLFTNVTKWYGSFLLWTVLALITIMVNYLITKDWGKEE
ncbi:hypothetical protein D8M06_15570 [Oceanobacillus halophilus]|uniref:DUF3311 domain-containing protein n=2 Tax=Oceanobacillus halophilus TaxID=930130 RepID=A0A494ZVS5_9BACI|nr:hypothetical protein [Oceanobacillus halophilus]RKQ30516.1 hypothetical protein D8M06_15570 [Oceanobacillus halophilus]